MQRCTRGMDETKGRASGFPQLEGTPPTPLHLIPQRIFAATHTQIAMCHLVPQLAAAFLSALTRTAIANDKR